MLLPFLGQQTGLLTGPAQPWKKLKLGEGWEGSCKLSQEKMTVFTEVRRHGPGEGARMPGPGLSPDQMGRNPEVDGPFLTSG